MVLVVTWILSFQCCLDASVFHLLAFRKLMLIGRPSASYSDQSNTGL